MLPPIRNNTAPASHISLDCAVARSPPSAARLRRHCSSDTISIGYSTYLQSVIQRQSSSRSRYAPGEFRLSPSDNHQSRFPLKDFQVRLRHNPSCRYLSSTCVPLYACTFREQSFYFFSAGLLATRFDMKPPNDPLAPFISS